MSSPCGTRTVAACRAGVAGIFRTIDAPCRRATHPDYRRDFVVGGAARNADDIHVDSDPHPSIRGETQATAEASRCRRLGPRSCSATRD
jgi:hypothetical protein